MLYPPVSPRRNGMLDVGDGHSIYWEESGRSDGIPVVVLHGGPGGECNDVSRRWFDPRRCRIITFDQRGCGRSLPHAGINHNTTPHLVRDLEALRCALDVDRWVLFGRSWGCVLALSYAAAHRERVAGVLLCGVFLGRGAELDWLYGGGAADVAPGAWQQFAGGRTARGAILEDYCTRLTCGDAAIEGAAAEAWGAWEAALARCPRGSTGPAGERAQLARARISAQYFRHRAFLEDDELIDRARGFGELPGIIVHGSEDMVTRATAACDLQAVWPYAELRLVPDGGHVLTEPAIMHAVVGAADLLIDRCAGSNTGKIAVT